MTAKKRWLNSIYNDYQDPHKCTQLSISWSSSESEDEYNKYVHARKRKKGQKCVNDFSVPSTSKCVYEYSTFNPKLMLGEASPIFKHSLDNSVVYTERLVIRENTESDRCIQSHSCDTKYEEKNVLSSNNNGSPMVNSLNIEELTPRSTQDIDINDNNSSPVLAVIPKRHGCKQKIGECISNKLNFQSCDVNDCKSEESSLSFKCSKYNTANNYFCDSPILCAIVKVQTDDIPKHLVTSDGIRSHNINHVLNSNDPYKSDQSVYHKDNDTSPILGKMSILRKLKSSHKKHQRKVITDTSPETSPELFKSQSSQLIEHDSPEFCHYVPTPTVDANISQTNEHFPNQCSSLQSKDINTNTETTTNSSSSGTDSSFLYHEPGRKIKKYKKGGLASLLQKTLNLQRTRTAIWHHEIYTKKFEAIGVEGEIIEFFIREEWKEYGRRLLECEILNKINVSSSTVLDSGKCENISDDNLFIIVMSTSIQLRSSYTRDHKFKLYPPYSSKNIMYKSKLVLCCFNVTRLISS